jgi:hypothetical protein
MRKHHKRTVQSGGATPDGKIPFPLMTKGERFIRCRGQRHGSRGRDLSDVEDRGMVPGGEEDRGIQGEIQRTEAWFQGEHE